MLRSLLAAPVLLIALLAPGGAVPAGAGEAPVFTSAIEGYADYQPQTRCRRHAGPGVRQLAQALAARGGQLGPIARSCAGPGTSEHKEARAFDWMLDARSGEDERAGRLFLDEVFAPDAAGNPHALARRMGIMYVIWNDRVWSSYRGFAERPYRSSSCPRRKGCSVTLRHRDHMHISLTRRAARGLTSWYVEQP
ncbi:hypothetical protein [Nocardioides houyundeii]|uniref:hypothetical protein n=1 Tax=Nocardioides houyundeii TaxID=2045452 RepID=UPI000DF49E7A|nr:hypothetical protein [Nocardioides houyundeii]